MSFTRPPGRRQDLKLQGLEECDQIFPFLGGEIEAKEMTSFNRVGLCAVWLEARRNLVFVHAPGIEPVFESGAQQPKMNAENDQAHGPIICFMALEEWASHRGAVIGPN